MKIKGPSIPTPPPQTPATTGKAPTEVKSKSAEVANVLSGMMGSAEEVRRQERKSKLSEEEKRKKLKAFGSTVGIKRNDSPKQATQKIVNHVLGEEYDAKDKGFNDMVEEITDFIQEGNPELKEKFDHWITVMQTQLDD